MDQDVRAHQLALRSGQRSIPGQAYLITAVCEGRNRWFEDHATARAVAARFHASDLLADSQLLAWVLMPDHAHWLLQLGERESLSALVGRIKGHAARAANVARLRAGRVWQPGFHDHALRHEEQLIEVARSVIANPVRAGLVRRVGDYPYWNAVWL